MQNRIINHRQKFKNIVRIGRDTARKILEGARKATPKVDLTIHGNRHTFAQMNFDEALEKYTEKEAKEKLAKI